MAVSKILARESKKFGDSSGQMEDKPGCSNSVQAKKCDAEVDCNGCMPMDWQGGSTQYINCNINLYSSSAPQPYPPSYCWPPMPSPYWCPPASYYNPDHDSPYPPTSSNTDLPKTSLNTDED